MATARVILLVAAVAMTEVAVGLAAEMEVGMEVPADTVAVREGRWVAPLVACLAVLRVETTARAGVEESVVAVVAAKVAVESSAVVAVVGAQVAAAVPEARMMGLQVEIEVEAGLEVVTAASCSHHTCRSSRVDRAVVSARAQHKSHRAGKACTSRLRARFGTCQTGSQHSCGSRFPLGMYLCCTASAGRHCTSGLGCTVRSSLTRPYIRPCSIR